MICFSELKRTQVKLSVLFYLLLHVSYIAYAKPFGEVSLYEEKDQVTLLNKDNFYSTLTHQPNAWLLQFYSSSCGHCIAFAPVYKDLAQSVSGI